MRYLCAPADFTSPPFALRCRDSRHFIFLTVLMAFTASAPVKATDADGDGIPADWELLRGSSDGDSVDAALDWDGDGLSLYLEYLTQGRPWGNYTLRRLPFASLPTDLPASAISA